MRFTVLLSIFGESGESGTVECFFSGDLRCIYECTHWAAENIASDLSFLRLDAAAVEQCANVSVNYVVKEHAIVSL
jgi:hypothetical protein